MDTIFTTENSQPTKTLADYINEGKSFLEAYQAQSPKRLARGKAYEQVEMLKELLNLLHQPDNTEVQQVTDILIPKTYPEKEKRFLNYLSWLTFISDRNKPKHPCPPLSEKFYCKPFVWDVMSSSANITYSIYWYPSDTLYNKPACLLNI